MRDPNDEAMTETLESDSSLHAQGIEVTDAQIEPASNTITVTFLSTGEAAPTTQAREMRDAMYVARSALATGQAATATACDVRCLTEQPIPSGPTPIQSSAPQTLPTLSFTGSITRDALATESGDLTSLTPTQLTNFFTNPWWQAG
jgi:hypothetical protein